MEEGRNDKPTMMMTFFRVEEMRLVDKIAEVSMFLSGPAPLLAGVGLNLALQAAKGIGDNVNQYCRRGRR